MHWHKPPGDSCVPTHERDQSLLVCVAKAWSVTLPNTLVATSGSQALLARKAVRIRRVWSASLTSELAMEPTAKRHVRLGFATRINEDQSCACVDMQESPGNMQWCIHISHLINLAYIGLVNCAHIINLRYVQNNSVCGHFERGEFVCLTMMNLHTLSIVNSCV